MNTDVPDDEGLGLREMFNHRFTEDDIADLHQYVNELLEGFKDPVNLDDPLVMLTLTVTALVSNVKRLEGQIAALEKQIADVRSHREWLN
jgi:hypothetical protein